MRAPNHKSRLRLADEQNMPDSALEMELQSDVDLSPELSRPTARDTERRRSTRHPHPVAAWLSGQAGAVKAAQQQVLVVNISLHGIGFRTSNPLTPGTTHWIVIGNGPMHLSARIRVVSCRIQDDNAFHIGAEFF
jgi:hypothetical protein